MDFEKKEIESYWNVYSFSFITLHYVPWHGLKFLPIDCFAVAGTGGKCYNSGQSTAYGEKYGVNDVVGVCMDFEKKEIEFYLNGDSQGVAFHNLTEPVHVAASMTATGEILQLRCVGLLSGTRCCFSYLGREQHKKRTRYGMYK